MSHGQNVVYGCIWAMVIPPSWGILITNENNPWHPCNSTVSPTIHHVLMQGPLAISMSLFRRKTPVTLPVLPQTGLWIESMSHIPIVSQDYKLQDVSLNWLKGNSQEIQHLLIEIISQFYVDVLWDQSFEYHWMFIHWLNPNVWWVDFYK